MSRYFLKAFTFVILMLTLCQCGKKHQEDDGYGLEFPMTKALFARIDSCMAYMNSDPKKAHSMLNAIRDEKLISPQRCDYLHATVVFSGENNLDSALIICERLLDEGKFGDDTFIEEEICNLASNIAYSCGRYVETLKYANRGIPLCHGHELMRNDEAAMMGRVGAAEEMLGRTEKAQETYRKAFELLKDDNTFGGLIASISIMKKQASLHFNAKDYDKSIAIWREILSIVQRFDRDPSFVESRPETMKTSGATTREFAEFYECQIYGNIAGAYHQMNVPDSVARYIDLWSKTAGAHSPENQASVLGELLYTGRMAEFNEAKASAARMYQEDSLVIDYLEYLKVLADEASLLHDYKASNDYLRRAVVVSDSIRQQDLLRKFSEQMSLGMVQEQQLARQDAENRLSQHRLAIMLLSVVLLIVVVSSIVIIFLLRKNQRNKEIIEMTQQDLTETKEEIQELTMQLEDSRGEKSVNTVQALYDRIQQVMDERQMYLHPDFDIRMLAEEICSSRTLVSVCINTITGKTFRQWLSEYRLTLFVKMMNENPKASLDDIMRQCGYQEQSTFRRQFKAMYGVTAGEYRKELLRKIGTETHE